MQSGPTHAFDVPYVFGTFQEFVDAFLSSFKAHTPRGTHSPHAAHTPRGTHTHPTAAAVGGAGAVVEIRARPGGLAQHAGDMQRDSRGTLSTHRGL